MLPKASPSVYQSQKCFVTYGSMSHTDTKQVSQRSKPWSNLKALDFIHKVDLILPQEPYETLRQQLVSDISPPCYYRVTMSLEQILHGEFFTQYIKRGNILMLSEGSTTMDNSFMLKEGVLTMYLDRETYERAGLVGKPHGAKGNRNHKPRWIVSYDLRSPSMLHGKRGFDRLVYASKKILNQSRTWHFCNLDESTSSLDPLQQHFPTKFTSSPGVVEDFEVKRVATLVPSPVLSEGNRMELETIASELYEWLSLIRLESPRARASDNVDPYLSTYRAPGDPSGKCKAWFALNATAFSRNITTGNELTLLRPSGVTGEYLMWEIKGPE